jgi:hypothetical protein
LLLPVVVVVVWTLVLKELTTTGPVLASALQCWLPLLLQQLVWVADWVLVSGCCH